MGATAAYVGTATTSASLAGSGTMIAATMTPIGWAGLAVIGADEDGLTWDCWKPILRDSSPEPSMGMTVNELLARQEIQSTTWHADHIEISNIWEEHFKLLPVRLPDGLIAFHATRCV